MTALSSIIEEADRHAKDAIRWGNTNHKWWFRLGIAAIGFGLLSAALAALGASSAAAGVAGLIAGSLGGVQSFASPEERAQWHFSHVGEFEALANEGRLLQDRPGGASEDEVRTLSQALKEVRTRKYPAGPSDANAKPT
jgi:hypothetical protein